MQPSLPSILNSLHAELSPHRFLCLILFAVHVQCKAELTPDQADPAPTAAEEEGEGDEQVAGMDSHSTVGASAF